MHVLDGVVVPWAYTESTTQTVSQSEFFSGITTVTDRHTDRQTTLLGLQQ